MASVSIESPNFHTRPRTTRFKSSDIEHLLRVDDRAGKRRGGNGKRAREINLGFHAAFASLEVACRRGDADLAIRKESDFGLAHPASRRDHLRAGFEERFDKPGRDALQVDLLRGGRDEKPYDLCEPAAL